MHDKEESFFFFPYCQKKCNVLGKEEKFSLLSSVNET